MAALAYGLEPDDKERRKQIVAELYETQARDTRDAATAEPQSNPPEDTGWTPPPADECEEYEYNSPVGDLGDLLRFRQCWDASGRMADFAIIQMTRLDGRLKRVAEACGRSGHSPR